ncbi:RluA family pseudouridine synthase [bacterium]|nr:RluA family pseudouridine synthase [bacterium]
MTETKYNFDVPDEITITRIDTFIVEKISETSKISRSRIAELIDKGFITVDNEKCRRSTKLRGGEKIIVNIPAPPTRELVPVKLELDIIFQDEHLAVINKPAGLIVHPSPTTSETTLVHALLYEFPDIANLNDDERPGIVHRLDKDTSGCLIIARTEEARLKLVEMFSDREIKKEYYALIKNVPRETKFEINKEIGRSSHDRKKMTVNTRKGKSALTKVTLIEQFGTIASALSVNIITGRTHQIRVHLADMGLPVIGDQTYGNAARILTKKTCAMRQMLHARKISFCHPITGEELSFTAKIPEDISNVRRCLVENGEL